MSSHEAGHARLIARVGGRRRRAHGLPGDDGRALVRAGLSQPVGRVGQALVRAPSVDRGQGGGLGQVVEDDEHVGQVEERRRQADGVCGWHRQALPARGRLVGQVADPGRQRDGQLRVGRADGELAAQGLQRIVRGEALELGVVAVQDAGGLAGHGQDAAADPDHGVAPVPRAALHRFEDEGEPVTQAERGRHRGDRVGAHLHGGDAAEAGTGKEGGHGWSSGASVRACRWACSWRKSMASR